MHNQHISVKSLVKAVGLALLLAPIFASAQSAIIYGSISNFDISNDTGRVCHGFEIELDGLDPSDVPYTFTAVRYGTPVVRTTPTGVAVRWESPFDASTGTFAERTLQHTVPWFPGQCYQWNPGTYEASGCEHFGVGVTGNPTRSSARWLCEDSVHPHSLVAVDPPTAVPMPTYYVAAPAAANNPPELVVEVEAPEPAEAPELYGNAQWIIVYERELTRSLTLDELLADNPAVVPMDPTQLEADYQIIQDEPASGNTDGRHRRRHQSGIAPTTRAIVRRIETYAYTGIYDPVTHEALCADGLCNVAAADEIGELLSVQMTAANVQPDAVIVSVSGSGDVDSTDRLISCGSKCAQNYRAGTQVTLTYKARSGFTFTGWSGACNGTQATCTVLANGAVNVGATFVATPSGGGGGGSRYTLTVNRSNAGTVVGTPAGKDRAINCGSACTAKFNAGTSVLLTATAPAGKQFLGWGGACAGTQATCTVTMGADRTVQANFSR